MYARDLVSGTQGLKNWVLHHFPHFPGAASAPEGVFWGLQKRCFFVSLLGRLRGWKDGENAISGTGLKRRKGRQLGK